MRKDIEIMRDVAAQLKISVPVTLSYDRSLLDIGVLGIADNAMKEIVLVPNHPDIEDTIKHELCHLALGRHGHGAEWQALMKKIGGRIQ